jgi:hypothetical protein
MNLSTCAIVQYNLTAVLPTIAVPGDPIENLCTHSEDRSARCVAPLDFRIGYVLAVARACSVSERAPDPINPIEQES